MDEKLSLHNYVELNSFLLEAAALSLDKQADHRRYIRLGKHVKLPALAETLTIKPEVLSKFFNRESVVDFLELSTQEGKFEQKAATLLGCFNIPALEQEFGSSHLKKALKQFTKLYFFTGDEEDKKKILHSLKRALKKLQEEGSEKLKKAVDLEKLQELIDTALEGQPFAWSKIPLALSIEGLTLTPYLHLGNALQCISQVVNKEAPNSLTLLNAIRWDTLLMKLPQLCGADERLISGLFDKKLLEDQLARLQNNLPLNPAALRNTIKKEALDKLGISHETLDEYIDFSKLATGLPKLRKNMPAPELREAINVKLIEEKTGLEVSCLFNPAVPEVVRADKFDNVVQNLSNRQIFEKSKIAVIACTATIFLWLIGHKMCHSCMEVLEPQEWYTWWPFCVALLYISYITMRSLDNPAPLKVGGANVALLKAVHVVKKISDMLPTTHENIIACVPHDYPARESIKEFLSLITPEQLQILSHPYCILTLFEDPRAFITKQEKFINALCRQDPERAAGVISYISRLLEAYSPFERLPHADSFKSFKELLTEEMIQELPHKDFLAIAQYRPHLLSRYVSFLKKVSRWRIAGDSLINVYYEVLELAQPQEDSYRV